MLAYITESQIIFRNTSYIYLSFQNQHLSLFFFLNKIKIYLFDIKLIGWEVKTLLVWRFIQVWADLYLDIWIGVGPRPCEF